MAVAIYKQIQPVLVLTKLDLQDGAALQELYTNAGIPVYPVCYDQPDTLEAVRACLRGKVSALTGNSGAGKSTLLNALYPDLQLKAGTWTAYDPTSFAVSAGWRLYCRYARILYV